MPASSRSNGAYIASRFELLKPHSRCKARVRIEREVPITSPIAAKADMSPQRRLPGRRSAGFQAEQMLSD